MRKYLDNMTMEQRRNLEGYGFISPWIFGTLFLFLIPLVQSIRLSFSEITQLSGYQMAWVGFENYRKLFLEDVNFIDYMTRAIQNTLINTPIIIIFSLVIAIMVNQKIKCRAFFRSAFFLPVLLGTGYVMDQLLGRGVAEEAVSAAQQVISPDGPLSYLGADLVMMLNQFLARITEIFWKSGVQILLFLSGLQSISPALYESAKCDGATSWEMFWKITLPLISPVILLNFIYTMIDSFTDSANPIVAYILEQSKSQQFEYGAAIGWIYFIFVFVFVMIVFGIINRFTVNLAEK
ncbi:MAG: sugar ABC transporter permease [Clostridia bacterium]|nr:sugar ABC transporter permease [Clostridia bacterium]